MSAFSNPGFGDIHRREEYKNILESLVTSPSKTALFLCGCFRLCEERNKNVFAAMVVDILDEQRLQARQVFRGIFMDRMFDIRSLLKYDGSFSVLGSRDVLQIISVQAFS